MDIKDTVKSSIKNLDKYPKWLASKYKSFVREKAIERVKTIIKLLVATSVYRWAKPKFKSLVILISVVLLTLYLHNEYLDWSDRTNNEKYVGLSYIIKNLLLFFSIGFYILLLRIQHLKSTEEIIEEKQIGDGFDKFRNKDTLISKSERILNKHK